ncbi:MAG TPA: glycosyltransferase family 2 protein [Acidisarcina sp.]
MSNLHACAVLVTFHPGLETLDNIVALCPQVEELIVVDNGSGADAVAMLSRASDVHPFLLIEHESNMGIAAALNVGVRTAISRGYEWVVLFDQDSTVTRGFMEAMERGYLKHPFREQVGVFCPEYVDRSTGHVFKTTDMLADGSPIIAMTSGSLMPVWIFSRCGWFMEDLFIDQVDVEYCFRLRTAGYLVARSPEARLLHAAGCPQPYCFWGLGKFHATHHSSLRRYYITRNRVWVITKYLRMHKNWCLPIFRSIVADTIKLVLVEESKLAKLRSTLAGVFDALRGKLGQRSAS